MGRQRTPAQIAATREKVKQRSLIECRYKTHRTIEQFFVNLGEQGARHRKKDVKLKNEATEFVENKGDSKKRTKNEPKSGGRSLLAASPKGLFFNGPRRVIFSRAMLRSNSEQLGAEGGEGRASSRARQPLEVGSNVYEAPHRGVSLPGRILGPRAVTLGTKRSWCGRRDGQGPIFDRAAFAVFQVPEHYRAAVALQFGSGVKPLPCGWRSRRGGVSALRAFCLYRVFLHAL